MLREPRRRTAVPGTAIFLTGDPDGAPTALMHNLKHNKVLHEKNVILTVEHRADAAGRRRASGVKIEPISADFTKVTHDLRLHGKPQRAEGAGALPQAGAAVRHHVDLLLPVAAERSRPSPHSGMPLWQDKLFIALARSADSTPPTISTSRRDAWSRSAHRSRSRFCTHNH